eukprot:Em0010g18a
MTLRGTVQDGQSALITPLLHASLHGHVQCVKALLDRGAQTNLQDKDGHNALMNASLYGHVECVNVLLGRGARPNLQDKDGRTALHWAAERNHIGTVKALLATPGIDVNIQDSHGVIPLKLATKYEVLAMLQKYTISCEDYPIHSFGKVILCGDTGSGKSTLAKGKPPGATLPGPVKPLTAGIVPHLIKNQEMNMMLYDLAGHLPPPSSCCSTFIMLLNLLLDIEDIAAQLYYWSAMIGDVCYKCPQQSSVIVVGTHADGIADRGLLESLCGAVERVARDALKMHTFVGVTAINATAIHGKIMKSFISSLRLTNDSVIAKHPAISLNSHMVYAFLIDKVPPHQDAISLPQLVILLGQEEPKVLPTEASQITLLLKTLSNKGFIVFLEGDEVNSWIVIRPESLLEKVNGVLFAPSFFKEHLPIASNTGVISVAVLRQHFPEPTYNIDMIVQFMKSFELCVPITLTNVDTNMTPAGSPNTPSTDPGPLLFFPACVSVEMPSSVIIPQRGFGWQINTADTNQFFSPRCVHALFTRLAHGWALPRVELALIAGQKGYNRRCTVWSRGISWMNKRAVTTVVEIKDNSRCLSCTITPSNESSPKYLLSVIKFIKEACVEFCPSVSLVEFITCPADATSDHTPARVELPLLKETVQTKENELIDSTGEKQVIVSEWMKVEPRLLDLIGMEKNEELATPSHPTLGQLLHFTGKAATFNVVALVGTAYFNMGVLLLKDETGAVVQALEHEHMRNAERINQDIFSRWLQGKGAQPVAWPTLIGVLRKIGLCVLADDIEGGLKK